MKVTFPRLLLYVLISITLLHSCTIQKRVHRKGYHIEWLKSHDDFSESQNTVIIPKETKEPEIIQTSSGPTTITSKSPITISNSCGPDTVSVENKIVSKAKPQEPNQPADDGITINFLNVSERKDNPSDYLPLNEPRKTMEIEKTGIWAFALSELGYFLPGPLAVLTFLIAILLAIISLRKISRYNERYLGKGFSLFALIASVIGFMLLFF